MLITNATPSATPSPREILTTILASAAFVEEWEVESDMFMQTLIAQTLQALAFFGWLRPLPERG